MPNDLARRFDQHVINNMRKDREVIERRLRQLDEPEPDTHDEWRKFNDAE
jgi:hypothetical protein